MVPLLMIFLTLTLKDSINRAANILVGIIYVGLSVIDIVDHLTNPSAYGLMMRTAILIATMLIVWHAYKWPKREA